MFDEGGIGDDRAPILAMRGVPDHGHEAAAARNPFIGTSPFEPDRLGVDPDRGAAVGGAGTDGQRAFADPRPPFRQFEPETPVAPQVFWTGRAVGEFGAGRRMSDEPADCGHRTTGRKRNLESKSLWLAQELRSG